MLRLLDAMAAVDSGAAPARALIHGDLINRNVLVDSDRITGVFDWGCGHWGDPLFDVAWIDTWTP